MRLSEALRVLREAPKDGVQFRVALAAGFTPLHVQTFLEAYLQRKLPSRRVKVTPGLFGDVAGSIDAAAVQSTTQYDAVALALEWSDLDPRLGYRELGAWGPQVVPEIVDSAALMLRRIAGSLEKATVPVAVSLPTLPLPPIFHTSGTHQGTAETVLKFRVAEFAASISQFPVVRLVSGSYVDQESPYPARFDLKSDFHAGLPYAITHARVIASALAELIAPPAPKKGLITDLDDTLWRGILGEAGVHGVKWDLSSHAQLHGLYQKLLSSLAGEGVLIGIASKNDPGLVAEALRRPDLLVSSSQLFPVEAHWQPKSISIRRILDAWNIAADSVVFVDDSPMELAEVEAAHAGIECLRFPTLDDRAGYDVLRRLRDLFGKPRLSDEDRVRVESIRRGAEFLQGVENPADQESFLAAAQAELALDFAGGSDPRALELVNKTNQFNLNGIRRNEAEWERNVAAGDGFTLVISYQDRFGPLGKIGVMQGRRSGDSLEVHTWVMSCRAFSRRIEHAALKYLFEHFGVSGIRFDFAATPRNGPLQDFLASMLGRAPVQGETLGAAEFERACPRLYHAVRAIEKNNHPEPEKVAHG